MSIFLHLPHSSPFSRGTVTPQTLFLLKSLQLFNNLTLHSYTELLSVFLHELSILLPGTMPHLQGNWDPGKKEGLLPTGVSWSTDLFAECFLNCSSKQAWKEQGHKYPKQLRLPVFNLSCLCKAAQSPLRAIGAEDAHPPKHDSVGTWGGKTPGECYSGDLVSTVQGHECLAQFWYYIQIIRSIFSTLLTGNKYLKIPSTFYKHYLNLSLII